jgi:hypothetical protein
MGSGIGSIPVDLLMKSIGDLLRATVPGAFKIETQTFPLSEVGRVWPEAGSTPRAVFLP